MAYEYPAPQFKVQTPIALMSTSSEERIKEISIDIIGGIYHIFKENFSIFCSYFMISSYLVLL